MNEWMWIALPLLVLPLVLLFRFVGCGTVLEIDADSERSSYRSFIMGEGGFFGTLPNPMFVPNPANVIGYWRLIDPENVVVTGDIKTAAPAKDQKGFQHGIYVEKVLDEIAPTPTDPGSEGAPGPDTIRIGQPSLVATPNSGAATSRQFKGGYVVVPHKPGLYTDEFTIEAWVRSEWGANVVEFEHTLFRAGGRYPLGLDPPGYRGFAVFANRDNRWQVRVFPTPGDLLPSPPPLRQVVLNKPTHVAVTVGKEGVKKRVRLFVDGLEAGAALVAAYSPPHDAPLYIAVGNSQVDPASTPQPYRPLIGCVQEVVLHNKALPLQEIQNHVAVGTSVPADN
jgi:hypothetical protein